MGLSRVLRASLDGGRAWLHTCSLAAMGPAAVTTHDQVTRQECAIAKVNTLGDFT